MSSKVCAVLGAGPGNGAAIANKFSNEGYAVALCARNEERLKEIASNIAGVHIYAYDVQDVGRADVVFTHIKSELGPVDTVVYNAGAGQFANIDDATVDAFQSAWEVNARGLFAATKCALPQMRSRGGGSIIVIGATASLKAGAPMTTKNASRTSPLTSQVLTSTLTTCRTWGAPMPCSPKSKTNLVPSI